MAFNGVGDRVKVALSAMIMTVVMASLTAFDVDSEDCSGKSWFCFIVGKPHDLKKKVRCIVDQKISIKQVLLSQT